MSALSTDFLYILIWSNKESQKDEKKIVVKMLCLKYFFYFCKSISIFFEEIYIEEYMNTSGFQNHQKACYGSTVWFNDLIHSLMQMCRGAKGTLLSEV